MLLQVSILFSIKLENKVSVKKLVSLPCVVSLPRMCLQPFY
jgi:hypothetical protein